MTNWITFHGYDIRKDRVSAVGNIVLSRNLVSVDFGLDVFLEGQEVFIHIDTGKLEGDDEIRTFLDNERDRFIKLLKS